MTALADLCVGPAAGRFDAAWDARRGLSLDEAGALALAGDVSCPRDDDAVPVDARGLYQKRPHICGTGLQSYRRY